LGGKKELPTTNLSRKKTKKSTKPGIEEWKGKKKGKKHHGSEPFERGGTRQATESIKKMGGKQKRRPQNI